MTSHSQRNHNRTRQHGNSLRRAPARIQNSITHSLRRRGVHGQDYSPINPFVKYLLFFINMGFLLAGAAVASACIYILVEKDKAITSFIEFLFDPACLFTLIGLVAFVVAVVGAYGALRENITCLKIYHYILSIILLLEILAIIFVVIFYFKEEALADIGLYPEDSFEDAIIKYRDDPDMQNFIDNMQDALSCCGSSNNDEGYKQWEANRYFNCSSENDSSEKCSVPFSCCRIGEGDQINYRCGAGVLKPQATGVEDKIYTRGCLKALKVILTDNIWYVGGGTILFFFLQIFFICLAKALVAQIEEQMSKWK
ncbi:tetraspanin [Plakobranchus ocellatus]|uniref:Tetraspanin n=1 Tax=Plakobranchus ocellatus TaxID=259542 RepID=A0AAV4DD76_9GAST|nr:tetraspanin [Plakobranchus ocellatus]